MYLTVHRGNEPESLVDQCIRYLLHSVDRFTFKFHDVNKFRCEDVKFPREISEKFLSMYEKSGKSVLSIISRLSQSRAISQSLN